MMQLIPNPFNRDHLVVFDNKHIIISHKVKIEIKSIASLSLQPVLRPLFGLNYNIIIECHDSARFSAHNIPGSEVRRAIKALRTGQSHVTVSKQPPLLLFGIAGLLPDMLVPRALAWLLLGGTVFVLAAIIYSLRAF